MKNYYSVLISIFIVFCLSACAVKQNKKTEFALGIISQELLLSSYDDFSDNFNAAELSSDDKQKIHQWPIDLKVDIYFGTWCHDSQIEVPKMLKILSSKSEILARLIALDYEKNDPLGLAHSKDIKYTPTFIFYRENKEIGRIVEKPTLSLVDDINVMLTNKEDA